MFINYEYPIGVTVDTSRNSGTSCGDDIVEFALSVQRRETVNFSIHDKATVYQNKLDQALQNGYISYDGDVQSVRILQTEARKG